MAKSSNLNGIGVLVTRPEHQAGHLCDLIAAAGGRPIRFPTLAIRDLGDTPAVDERLAKLADIHIAIFISPNAVRFGLPAIDRHGGLPEGLLLATVGNGSALALQAALGREPDIVPTDNYDSEALLALPALQQVAGQRILILRGEGGRELLADTLRERGATVEYAEVYRRECPEPTDGRDWLEKADIITVTSSESLQNLVEMTPALQRALLLSKPLVVISERTARLAATLGFRQPPVLTARAGDEAILDGIREWADSQLPHHGTITMSEETEITEIPEEKEHLPEKQSSGSSGTFLAVAIALAAAGGGYYLWQQQQAMHLESRKIEQKIASLRSSLEERQTTQSRRINALEGHQHPETAEQLARVEALAYELRSRVGQERREWAVAEVEYLLRVAGLRLKLEHDRNTALAALQEARARLADLEQTVFWPVISQIEEDIDKLSAISLPDRDRIAAELASLASEVENWPTIVDESTAQEQEPSPGNETTEQANGGDDWKAKLSGIWQDIRGLVTIRHDGAIPRPMLHPEHQYFLRQNLQLKLEAARLALLGGNSHIFRDSLEDASSWLERYFDTTSTPISEARLRLNELQALDIQPSLPELGNSIELLRQASLRLPARNEAASAESESDGDTLSEEANQPEEGNAGQNSPAPSDGSVTAPAGNGK